MKQTLQGSTESDKRLIFLVNTIKEIVWEADAEGKIVYANRAWYDYIGRDEGDDISEVWLEVLHPDDVERCLSIWMESVKTGKPYEVEYRFRHAATGNYEWFVGGAMPYRNSAGEIERWYGTCTNIEERKENAALIETNKAKDEFISIASHQLRTPATAVKQYIGMVLEGFGGELQDTQQTLLKKAYENNERQLRIVSDMLRVAMIEMKTAKLRKKKVDINHLVHSMIGGYVNRFRDRGQAVSFNGAKTSVYAVVDEDSVMMVLDNLIENASKYTPANGSVEVDVTEDETSVYISIKDDGVGIDPEDEDKLFKKFSRIDNELSTVVGGTGLGLYWVKRMVDMHGGLVKYTPNDPKGSIFTLQLPKDEKGKDTDEQ